ncbi:MAG: hypothetical protein ACREMY_09460 [bacterium]
MRLDLSPLTNSTATPNNRAKVLQPRFTGDGIFFLSGAKETGGISVTSTRIKKRWRWRSDANDVVVLLSPIGGKYDIPFMTEVATLFLEASLWDKSAVAVLNAKPNPSRKVASKARGLN